MSVHFKRHPQPAARFREGIQRSKARELFEKYDENHDGKIEIKELQTLIREHPSKCADLPKYFAVAIFKVHDVDEDGKLDFEEFFKLCQDESWLLRDLCVKYCNIVVPRKKLEIGSGGFDDVDGCYEKQARFWPLPLTMFIFSAVQISFFVADKYLQNKPASDMFRYHPQRREELWRFVTYMFIHINMNHIMMNMVVQLFLGTVLEIFHGWRVTLVYMSGVLAGSMGASIAQPTIHLAGASGGVYALIAAHIANLILNWEDMESSIVIIQMIVFSTFCCLDVGSALYSVLSGSNDPVSHMSHLCGAIAGLLVGLVVLKNMTVQSHEKLLWWLAAVTYTALMVAGISYHVFSSNHFLPSQVS